MQCLEGKAHQRRMSLELLEEIGAQRGQSHQHRLGEATAGQLSVIWKWCRQHRTDQLKGGPMVAPTSKRRRDTFHGNRDHLGRLQHALKQPSQASWNQWRKENPTLQPDLRGLDIDMLDHRGIPFHGVPSFRLHRVPLGVGPISVASRNLPEGYRSGGSLRSLPSLSVRTLRMGSHLRGVGLRLG